MFLSTTFVNSNLNFKCVIGIKNGFVAHVHKFMATLIDTKYKIQGKTVLYVPNEGSILTVQQAAQNKEYVQRLESMYHQVLVYVNVFCIYTFLVHLNSDRQNTRLQFLHKSAKSIIYNEIILIL